MRHSVMQEGSEVNHLLEITPAWKSTFPEAHAGVSVMRHASHPADRTALELFSSAHSRSLILLPENLSQLKVGKNNTQI